MILTDSDIRKSIKSGLIEISNFNPSRLGSNSYDLTLNNTLLVYNDAILDCKKDNPYSFIQIPEEGMTLQPGELYLGVTNEFTRTKKLIPCIEGKSSVARLGISVHLTAGFGDVGFSGHWTLEISVVKPVIVYPDMPICQIYYTMPLGDCTVPYSLKPDAKYKDQPPIPIASQMFKNFV